jgi:hypothetical protein
VNADRVSAGAAAATVAAGAGVVALLAIILDPSIGQPFGTINDIALLLMTTALAPVMLAHYELGGVVPLWPARLSLAGALGLVAIWAVLQAAMIVGLVAFDDDHPATGPFAISSWLQFGIGLWIAGASLLAGSWLPMAVRILGLLAGLGTVLLSIGLLQGGFEHPLAYAGGVGYRLVLPVWVYLLGSVFRARAGSIMEAGSVAGAVAHEH